MFGLSDRRNWGEPILFSDNDISATKGKHRPGYAALLDAIQRGQIKRVIVWHQSRIWRNRRERAEGIEIMKKHGVTLVCVKGPELDMSTAYGRGVAGLIGEFDTMEVEVKSERQTREAQQRAARGEPGGGRRAFGYSSDGLSVVKDEAAAVRWAFGQLLAEEALSAIAAGLNDAGWTTTMGGPWKHNAVRNMLQNARYTGQRVYRGEIVAEGVWKRIVSDETFAAAVALLSGPDRKTNHAGSARKWLGTGLYECASDRCDSLGHKFVTTYREKYDDGRPRRIYRCPACKLSRLAEPVDEFVEEVMEERLALPDLADILAAEISDRGAIRARLVDLRGRRRSLAKLLVDGVLTEAEVREEATRLDQSIAELAGSVGDTGDRRARARLLGAPDPVAAWRAMEGDPYARRDAVRLVMTVRLLPVHLGRRTFDPATVRIDWRTA